MASATITTTTEKETIDPKTSNVTTHRANYSSSRLLYRGSLCLPDSEMLLDGIIFVMQLDYKSPMSLISSPIPLGLESMRGRSLRLISPMDIQDVQLDCTGDVSMHIHPEAFLTRSFFERTLCSMPSTLVPVGNYLRTTLAVRVGLGDGDGPDDSDIIIFGQASPSAFPSDPTQSNSTTSNQSSQVLKLVVGRIAPPPLPPSPPRKVARPDDPLPRPHPLANLHLSPGRRGLKRKRSTANDPFGISDPLSPALVGSPSALATAIAKAEAEAQAQSERKKKGGKIVLADGDAERRGIAKRPTLFKVPSSSTSPSPSPSVSSRGQSVDKDGFLVPGVPIRALATRPKGKEREREKTSDNLNDPAAISFERNTSQDSNPAESELEVKNKTAIKKRTLSALDACGISKTHPQFKDMYGWIHRGVAFAVRNIIQDSKVDRDLITKLIDTHLGMYFGGRGGSLALLASPNINMNISNEVAQDQHKAANQSIESNERNQTYQMEQAEDVTPTTPTAPMTSNLHITKGPIDDTEASSKRHSIEPNESIDTSMDAEGAKSAWKRQSTYVATQYSRPSLKNYNAT